MNKVLVDDNCLGVIEIIVDILHGESDEELMDIEFLRKRIGTMQHVLRCMRNDTMPTDKSAIELMGT